MFGDNFPIKKTDLADFFFVWHKWRIFKFNLWVVQNDLPHEKIKEENKPVLCLWLFISRFVSIECHVQDHKEQFCLCFQETKKSHTFVAQITWTMSNLLTFWNCEIKMQNYLSSWWRTASSVTNPVVFSHCCCVYKAR